MSALRECERVPGLSSFDHGELENRLRDRGALQRPCPECGNTSPATIDPMKYGLQEYVGDMPGGLTELRTSICPRCGYVRVFFPAVIQADEEQTE